MLKFSVDFLFVLLLAYLAGSIGTSITGSPDMDAYVIFGALIIAVIMISAGIIRLATKGDRRKADLS